MRTRLYRNGILEAENFPAAEVSDHIGDSAATVWLDLCAPTESDLATVGEELGLHQLAIEDAVLAQERPKLDRYDSHSFLTAYAVWVDSDSGELTTSELAAFVTERAVVTVRKDERFDIGAVVERWDASADMAKSGVAYLLHGLLDYVVDSHFDAVQALDDHIENLEDLVFADHSDPAAIQRQSLRLRKSLVLLRRVVLPMREVVNTLIRRDHHLVGESLGPYFQDVYDHVLRASEWTESQRELLATIRETQLSLQSNRLNSIMKKVTGWAAIIAVPTAITGYYGQNLPYPGAEQMWGFWTSTAAVFVISGALYVLFRRRDWL